MEFQGVSPGRILHPLPQFAYRLQPGGKKVGLQSVHFPSTTIFLIGVQSMPEAGVTYAPGPHFYQHLRYIGSLYPVFIQKSQHQLVIGRGAEGKIKQSVLIIQFSPYKKSRVRRHPSVAKAVTVVRTRSPFADDFPGILGIDVIQIAVDRLYLRIGKGFLDQRQHLIAGVEIVGIQDTDDVAGGPLNTFVHGIVEALVTFGYTVGQIRPGDGNRIILGATILDNVRNGNSFLSLNSPAGIREGSGTIVGGGDDGESHDGLESEWAGWKGICGKCTLCNSVLLHGLKTTE